MRVLFACILGLPVIAACGDGERSGAAQDEHLVISEIDYLDRRGGTSGAFVEIHNPRNSDVDLKGWCIKGLDSCFDDHTRIAADGYLVVKDSDARGTLSVGGERLRLVDDGGLVHDEVTYSDRAPWPEMPDGWGYSLQRVLPATSGSNPASWTVGPPTPGGPNDPTDLVIEAPVVISEIHYRSLSGNRRLEFIEVHNPTADPVDISGWCVRELGYCFGDGTVLKSGSYRKVTDYQSSAVLDRRGGWLTLVDGDTVVDTVAYDDRAPWPSTADGTGLSLQRRSSSVLGFEPGNWMAAEPTPGAPNREVSGDVLPMFDSVSFARTPLPTEPIEVTASVRNGGVPTMFYRVGFADEVEVTMSAGVDGGYVASIPPQPSGSLVRFRLVSSRGQSQGSWPRPGDGAGYTGTVVWSEADSFLPRLQWFMPDDLYETAYRDVRKRGDDGYPAVFAFDGEIFDNARIRVKGQNTRDLDKRKWKVALPVGYRWDMGGRLADPVNEFALHSMSTDRAMINELLTYEVQKLSGGMAQQVEPLRLERNGRFYGVYLYVEQDDGIWRNKYGFSEQTVVYEGRWGAQLPIEDLALDDWGWTLRYRRATHRYVEDSRAELADLITNLGAFVPSNSETVRPFVYRHIDIPSVVEAIATMRITQNLDWARKNWTLLYDPVDEKWRLYPTDHDLSFGRRYAWACGITCSKIEALSESDLFELNRLGAVFLEIPELRAMIDRRTRELAAKFYAPFAVEQRLAEWQFLLGDDAYADRLAWPTFGNGISVAGAKQVFLTDYLEPKRRMMLPGGTDILPRLQTLTPQLRTETLANGDVRVTNLEDSAIDLSGMMLSGLEAPVPAGLVLNSGQSAVLSTRREPAPKQPRVAGTRRTLYVWVPAP